MRTALAILLVTMLAVAAAPAHAATGDGVSVAPSAQQLFVKPGGSVRSGIVVTNGTADRTLFKVTLIPMEVGDSQLGEVVATQEGSEPLLTHYEIRPAFLKLAPGERGVVRVRIWAPADAKPGTHLVALRVDQQAIARGRSNNFAPPTGAIARVLSVLAVDVAGKVKRTARIDSVSVSERTSAHPVGAVRVRNTGDVLLVLSGSVEVTGAGPTSGERREMPSTTIYPGASTVVRVELPPLAAPGRYHVRAAVRSQDMHVTATSAVIWRLTPLLAALMVAGVALVAASLALAIVRVRRALAGRRKPL